MTMVTPCQIVVAGPFCIDAIKLMLKGLKIFYVETKILLSFTRCRYERSHIDISSAIKKMTIRYAPLEHKW